jgi:hypothetical protein
MGLLFKIITIIIKVKKGLFYHACNAHPTPSPPIWKKNVYILFYVFIILNLKKKPKHLLQVRIYQDFALDPLEDSRQHSQPQSPLS